jgi:ferredoxin--NADP+ reductase
MSYSKLLQYNATLVERIDATDKLSIFRVIPDSDWGPKSNGLTPDFEAGQYLMFGLNNEEQPEKGSVQRAYSIASPPEDKRWMEFYIRLVDAPTSDNPLTRLLWKLKEGDRLYLGKKIVGHFTLGKTVGEQDPRLKVMVASGTGLAPFLSVMRSGRHRGVGLEHFAMLHGASFAADLGFRVELETLYHRWPNLYMPSVSRPWASPEWTGATGRIESHFDDPAKLEALEKRLGLGTRGLVPERAVVYVCGLTGTIRNIVLAMFRRGFVPNNRAIRKALGLLDMQPTLFYEQYDNEPVIDVDDPEVAAKILADAPFAERAPR